MPELPSDPLTTGNRLLDGLPAKVLDRLRKHLEPVSLVNKRILTKQGGRIRHIYFPQKGMVSLVQPLNGGKMIEVGLIGREGLVGIAVVLGGSRSLVEAMVQMPGSALRMPPHVLRKELGQNSAVSVLSLRYVQALHNQISQTAACNGRHALVERLARWLLMARDRADGDVLPLRHEFLSLMLGMRRAGVTSALGSLRSAGLISTSYGSVIILERQGLEAASCACYRTERREYRRLFPQRGLK
jgi:CRP-like cAMP-binding protein